jgi:hypothetical protein
MGQCSAVWGHCLQCSANDPHTPCRDAAKPAGRARQARPYSSGPRPSGPADVREAWCGASKGPSLSLLAGRKAWRHAWPRRDRLGLRGVACLMPACQQTSTDASMPADLASTTRYRPQSSPSYPRPVPHATAPLRTSNPIRHYHTALLLSACLMPACPDTTRPRQGLPHRRRA